MGSFNKKILVIEDDIEVRETIAEILKNAGHTPVPLEDGLQALNFLENEIPDLIISDITMPNVNGYEVFEHVKRITTHVIVPFIFISAKTDSSEINTCIENGADDYITKPFRAKELMLAIENQLRKKEKVDNISARINGYNRAFIPQELVTPVLSILSYPDLISENFSSLNEKEIFSMLTQLKRAGLQLNKAIDEYVKHIEIQTRLALKNESSNHGYIV